MRMTFATLLANIFTQSQNSPHRKHLLTSVQNVYLGPFQTSMM